MNERKNKRKKIKEKINRISIIEYIQNQNLTSIRICNYLRYIAKKYKISIKKVLEILFSNKWQSMIFLLPTADLLDFVAGFVKKLHIKFILELSAGHGLIASAIYADLKDRNTQVKYVAVDNYSYGFKLPLFYPVKKISNIQALKLYKRKRKKLILAFYPGVSLYYLIKKLRNYTKHFIYIGWPHDFNKKIKNIKMIEYEIDVLSVWNFINPDKIKYSNNLKFNYNDIQVLFITYK